MLLLLLVAVLLPTACVLWFMNEAIGNQRHVVRQKFADAYRSQLLLLRERLDGYWEERASALDKAAESAGGAALFLKVLAEADSAICFAPSGEFAYPAPPPLPAPEPGDEGWVRARRLENDSSPAGLRAAAAAYGALAASANNTTAAARALQAQARCLVRAGSRNEAVAIALGRLGPARSRTADLEGRLVAGDMLLMALQLMGPGDARFAPAAAALRRLLLEYGSTGLPSSQRLFLMREMRRLVPAPELADFPTFDAESLAARFLEAEPGARPEPALRSSALPEVWKLGAPRKRVLALLRTATVVSQIERFIAGRGLPQDVRAVLTPPGSMPAQGQMLESLPAGPRLPGWQLTLYLAGAEPFEQLAEKQMGLYLWTGALVIAAVVILALLAAGAIRRQARLARLKTDLAAAVSHELKTPLSSMRLLVDTLLDDAQLDPVKTREYLELIARENSRLSHLIENFLAFSRMERNKLVFDFREARAEDIVREACAAVHERFNAPGCRFEVYTAPDLPPLRADEGALVTVLVNLLDNAYKYSPGDKYIRLRATGAPGGLCFEVEDSGVGIALREVNKIFRRFYQVDRRLSRTGGGCGLGLTIVKFIVDAHGGRVEVESRPGKGSLFRVTLPCSPVAEEAALR